jgi:phage-related protein
VTETNGGTERVRPVLTLTANATLTDTTVSIENEATGETIEWTGSLVATDVLVINCATGYVTLNGAASMGMVDGQFIHLVPGENRLTVSGFSGVMNAGYRNRYA